MDENIFKNCKRLAIMGGTFDPIHYGHLVAAEAALHKFELDKVIFMPAGNPVFKKGTRVADKESRFIMTFLATLGNKHFEVSRLEIEREGDTYTIDTVEQVRKLCDPDVKLYFITGADAISYIFSWKDPVRLVSMCEFIAVTRPGYKNCTLFDNIEKLSDKYKNKIHYMEIPALSISSTDIRQRVKLNYPIKYLLPDNVVSFIEKAGLYKEESLSGEDIMMDFETMRQKLQSSLYIKRYIHTMGVVEEAEKLAKIYGSDITVEKARIAALLHDCAKDFPTELKIRFCKEYHVYLDEIMKENTDLIHSFLGAEVAKRDYLVLDNEILDAIRFHTTGRKNMTLLEKIIFIADFTEKGREPFEGLSEARRLSYIDLNMALKFILESVIKHVTGKGRALHPLSCEALEYYKNK